MSATAISQQWRADSASQERIPGSQDGGGNRHSTLGGVASGTPDAGGGMVAVAGGSGSSWWVSRELELESLLAAGNPQVPLPVGKRHSRGLETSRSLWGSLMASKGSWRPEPSAGVHAVRSSSSAGDSACGSCQVLDVVTKPADQPAGDARGCPAGVPCDQNQQQRLLHWPQLQLRQQQEEQEAALHPISARHTRPPATQQQAVAQPAEWSADVMAYQQQQLDASWNMMSHQQAFHTGSSAPASQPATSDQPAGDPWNAPDSHRWRAPPLSQPASQAAISDATMASDPWSAPDSHRWSTSPLSQSASRAASSDDMMASDPWSAQDSHRWSAPPLSQPASQAASSDDMMANRTSGTPLPCRSAPDASLQAPFTTTTTTGLSVPTMPVQILNSQQQACLHAMLQPAASMPPPGWQDEQAREHASLQPAAGMWPPQWQAYHGHGWVMAPPHPWMADTTPTHAQLQPPPAASMLQPHHQQGLPAASTPGNAGARWPLGLNNGGPGRGGHNSDTRRTN